MSEQKAEPSEAAVRFNEGAGLPCPHSEPENVADCNVCLPLLFDAHAGKLVAAEKERCAKIARKVFEDCDRGQYYCCAEGAEIATEIREGK